MLISVTGSVRETLVPVAASTVDGPRTKSEIAKNDLGDAVVQKLMGVSQDKNRLKNHQKVIMTEMMERVEGMLEIRRAAALLFDSDRCNASERVAMTPKVVTEVGEMIVLYSYCDSPSTTLGLQKLDFESI